jgi:hypothetical protein
VAVTSRGLRPVGIEYDAASVSEPKGDGVAERVPRKSARAALTEPERRRTRWPPNSPCHPKMDGVAF